MGQKEVVLRRKGRTHNSVGDGSGSNIPRNNVPREENTSSLPLRKFSYVHEPQKKKVVVLACCLNVLTTDVEIDGICSEEEERKHPKGLDDVSLMPAPEDQQGLDSLAWGTDQQDSSLDYLSSPASPIILRPAISEPTNHLDAKSTEENKSTSYADKSPGNLKSPDTIVRNVLGELNLAEDESNEWTNPGKDENEVPPNIEYVEVMDTLVEYLHETVVEQSKTNHPPKFDFLDFPFLNHIGLLHELIEPAKRRKKPSLSGIGSLMLLQLHAHTKLDDNIQLTHDHVVGASQKYATELFKAIAETTEE
ncbi:unnamed protein product [Cochlearia groenlandica]